MAEAIGLASSVIGIGELVAQVGKGILKLKAFWADIKEAPDDIAYQLRELDILMSSLTNIETQNKKNQLPSHIFDISDMRRSLDLCSEGAKELADLVTELSTKITAGSRLKKKIEAAKVVLKKDEIRKIKTRLESSIRLLRMSGEIYDRVIAQVRFDILSTQLSKFAPESQVIDMPISIQSVFSSENTLESSISQCSIQSYSASTTIATQGQSLQRKGEVSRSLWIRGNKLFGTIEWETKSVRSTIVYQDRNDGNEHYTAGQSIRICIHPPTWLMRKSWQALHGNMVGEWRFSFRTYNNSLPWDAPVLNCIRIGDLDGLKTLFASKQATPFDKDIGDRSLLEYACSWGRHEISDFLMDQTESVQDARQAQLLFGEFMRGRPSKDLSKHERFCQRLLQYVTSSRNFDLHDLNMRTPLIILNGDFTASQFAVAISVLFPNYYEMPQNRRTAVALRAVSYIPIISPDFLWLILSPKHNLLDQGIANTIQKWPPSLIHCSADILGRLSLIPAFSLCRNQSQSKTLMPRFSNRLSSQAHTLWFSESRKIQGLLWKINQRFCEVCYEDEELLSLSFQTCRVQILDLIEDWHVFLKHLVDAGANIHLKCTDSRTPMMWAISYTMHRLLMEFSDVYVRVELNFATIAMIVMRTWLKALLAVGVDLQRYGKTEKDLHLRGEINRCFSASYWLPGEGSKLSEYNPKITWRLISFTYGPSPQDWHLWFSEPTDIFAGQFWNMIEHPVYKMPGTWINDEEWSDEERDYEL